LSGVIFAGGVTEEKIKQVVDDMKGGGVHWGPIADVKNTLRYHLGSEKSHELPHGVQGGRYGEEEANRWIEEYNKAMEKAKAKAKAAAGDNEVK